MHRVDATGLSWLERELREQADVLQARTEPGREQAGAAARVLRGSDVRYVVAAARGTSDNAARYAQYLFGMEWRMPVALAAPWLYSGDAPPLLDGAAVLAISQSGRSPDITAVVAAAREQRRPTVVITNDVASPLAAQADVVVELRAGKERSVAATKTYLASLHAIAQIALGSASNEWTQRLPGLLSQMVDEQLSGRERFDVLDRVRLVTAIGRGLQFPTAFETALKLRELSGIAAEAFSPPDLEHGPIAALGAGGAVWLVSTAGRSQPDGAAFSSLRHGSAVSVAVSDRADVVGAADIGIPIAPGLPAWLAPMLAVVPGQAAALRLGELRGVDLDHPHGLTKVTLTE